MIRKDYHAIFETLDQRVVGSVMQVGGVTCPAYHLSVMIEQGTEFTSDNSVLDRVTFLANLLLQWKRWWAHPQPFACDPDGTPVVNILTMFETALNYPL